MNEATDIKRYIAAVHEALLDVPATERHEALVELEENLAADVERRGGNPAAEAAAIADLGSPEEYAAAIREALGDTAGLAAPQGRILGMPYEFRPITTERIMERMWNPADPRIFMPRTFGIGWTINFGAIAVRLGAARPDDVEERPFENLPRGAFIAAVSLPLAIGAAALALAAVYWTRLPAEVPVHFNGAGAPDDWAAKGIAVGLMLAVAAAAPVLVLGRHALRRASRGMIAVTSVLLTLIGLLALVILGYTIANVVYNVTGWWISLLILGSLIVPGTMFYLLARASIKREWREALPKEESR